MGINLPVGRELDALIAEHVFGLRKVTGAEVPKPHTPSDGLEQVAWVDANGEQFYCAQCGNMPTYSTDIADAWQVVEKMALWAVSPVESEYVAGQNFRKRMDTLVRYSASDAADRICGFALEAIGYKEG